MSSFQVSLKKRKSDHKSASQNECRITEDSVWSVCMSVCVCVNTVPALTQPELELFLDEKIAEGQRHAR